MKTRVSLKYFVSYCWSVTIEENTNLIEELVCSKEEEAPHTHTPNTS